MVSKMDRLCNLGKKVCVAGAVLVSLPVAVPIIVPSLFVLSVVGVALAIPVGSAAVGFVVVKRVLGLGKQTAGYILAPPARLYENKEEIFVEEFGERCVESDKDFAACDGATEIEEEALAPVTQLYQPKKVSGDSVSEIVEEDFAVCEAESVAPEIEEEALAPASQLYSGDLEIVEEEPVKYDLPISRPYEAESEPSSPPTQVYGEIVEEEPVKHDLPISRASEAESGPLSPPTQVYGDSRSGYEVVAENSGNPGGDSCGVTVESAAESEHVKAEPEALTSPTQLYETKQVNGHPYSGEMVGKYSFRHSDASNKDNAGNHGPTESKEAAQASDSTEILGGNCSHVSEEFTGDQDAEAKNPEFGDELGVAENCNVEASPKLESPKLLTENSLEPLADNPESVVQVPDVGEICVEEAPEKCWEAADTAVYVKGFEDVDSARVALPCKSAPDFYDCMEAKEIGSVAVTEGNENAYEAKDVRVADLSPKLLELDVVPEPVENVADVSVELAPEMCWETATKAAEPERLCVEDSEDVDSLKNAFPCKSAPDFYEHMDVKELDSVDDHAKEDVSEEETGTVHENAQQDSEVKEGNAEEIVQDGVALASRKWEPPLNRVESFGCLEDSAGQIHFENAGGQVPTAYIDEAGSLAEDEIALGSDARSCGPKSEVTSLLKPPASMIPV